MTGSEWLRVAAVALLVVLMWECAKVLFFWIFGPTDLDGLRDSPEPFRAPMRTITPPQHAPPSKKPARVRTHT